MNTYNLYVQSHYFLVAKTELKWVPDQPLRIDFHYNFKGDVKLHRYATLSEKWNLNLENKTCVLNTYSTVLGAAFKSKLTEN